MVDFFDVLRARRSVRHFDASHQIPEGEITDMIREATWAPSGYNVQSWRFLVVTDPAIKQKILPIAFGQEQVVQASAVVIVLADKRAYEKLDQIYTQAVQVGCMDEAAKQSLYAAAMASYSKFNPAYESETIMRDNMIMNSTLAAMQLMLVARARGYDTVPMVGYQHEKLRALLGITERFVDVMILPLGKSAEPGHASARLDPSEVIFWNKMA